MIDLIEYVGANLFDGDEPEEWGVSVVSGEALFEVLMGYLKEEQYENDKYEWCYECTGNGDDYRIGDDGEFVCNCDGCIHNRMDDD